MSSEAALGLAALFNGGCIVQGNSSVMRPFDGWATLQWVQPDRLFFASARNAYIQDAHECKAWSLSRDWSICGLLNRILPG